MNKSLSISLFGIPTKTIFLFFTTLTLLLYGACSSNVSTETPTPTPEPPQTNQTTPQTYTITFNTNGGSEVQSRKVNSGDTVAKPDDPTRRGYRFLNWYSNLDAPSTAYDFGTKVTTNITLYANWIKKFDVKFITNTGSGVTRAGGNENNNNIETIPVDSNATISVPSQVPTREGYRFLNWYSDPDAPSTAYDFSTKVTTNVTLYANWLKTFTVTFNMNGGTAVASQTIDSGKVVTKPTNPTNEKHGGTFEAWYSNEELTADSEYGDDDFDDPVIKNLSLYAKWSYMVTYNATTGAITGFNGDTSLSAGDVRLVIPSNINGIEVDSIRVEAFRNNRRIVSLKIADGIKYIGESAFYRCTGFTGSLTIPNSVETIGDGAFSGCRGFTGDLTIGNSVVTIGNEAFLSCRGFDGRLTIGNSVVTIGRSAFSGCTGFKRSVTIPSSVKTIARAAFSDMDGIDTFIFESNMPPKMPSAFGPLGLFIGRVPSFDVIIVPDENAVTQYKQEFPGSRNIVNRIRASE